MKPVGVILAGGQATRMGGGDKGRLLLGQQSVLDHVIARMTPQVSQIAINANGDATRFDDLGLPVISDSMEGFVGPLAGVLAGLDWAAGNGLDQIVTVAADTPFFPPDLVAQLTAASAHMEIPLALAATEEADGKVWAQPTFGLWPVALREDLREALADGLRKVVRWTDKHGAAQAVFDALEFDPFFNINTPDDLIAAQAMAQDLS